MGLAEQVLQVLLESRGRGPSEVSLDLQVSHGQEDLVVLQQGGQQAHGLLGEMLLEVPGVVCCSPVLECILLESSPLTRLTNSTFFLPTSFLFRVDSPLLLFFFSPLKLALSRSSAETVAPRLALLCLG